MHEVRERPSRRSVANAAASMLYLQAENKAIISELEMAKNGTLAR